MAYLSSTEKQMIETLLERVRKDLETHYQAAPVTFGNMRVVRDAETGKVLHFYVDVSFPLTDMDGDTHTVSKSKDIWNE